MYSSQGDKFECEISDFSNRDKEKRPKELFFSLLSPSEGTNSRIKSFFLISVVPVVGLCLRQREEVASRDTKCQGEA